MTAPEREPLDLEVAQQFADDFKKMKCFSPLPARWIDGLIVGLKREKAARERAEKVVEAARREIEKEHAGWDAAHTPPGKPCELCSALNVYDAIRAGGSK